MDLTRKRALVAGVLFIVTFITSIPAVILYGPVLSQPGYIVSAGASDTSVLLGAFLEIILAIANIGTAVVLFPIVKRQSEPIALGYVASRIVESIMIAVGVLSLLSLLALRQEFAGAAAADAALPIAIGKSLVALHNQTFLLGPGLLAGFGNGLLLGYLLYTSALVPRALALLGLVGGPLIFASGIAVMFGLYEQLSTVSMIATLPEAVWEAGLGIWLIVKGFRPAPILQP